MTAPAPSTPRSVLAMRDQVDILIVDDRRENLLALEAILEPLGQRVVQAHSGEEALRKLLQKDFAVVLLDVQMPGMNGFETAQLMKSRERTRYIPIIFLTAISKEEEYVFRGYQVGAVDYLSKPFQPDVLRAKVAVFVDLHLKQKRLAEQESKLRDSERRMTELRHMKEMLQSEARFREIVSTAMDAIVIFDENDKITIFNGAAERMFKTSAAKAIGHPISDFFRDEGSMQAVRSMCASMKTEKSDDGAPASQHVTSLKGHRASGEEFPLEVSISCVEGKEGTQFTLIVRDVSERMRQERALREQAAKLERAMADLKAANDELNLRQEDLERAMTARSRFYASMSHELRTPINAVLGYSTLLLENIYGPLNEKQAEGIQRTQRAAKHLLELVNDVLDLSKIEAGKIDLRLQPVTFPTIVEELFVTVRPLADKYGTKLALEQDASISVVSDPRRVRQILLNLLSNAIKFGASKPVRVRVERSADGGVSIAVIDQGEGIPAEDQDRIFQEFVQLGKTQLQEGTGLGLPISKRLAELLHGELTLESRPGAGSTFRLTLPPNADVRRVLEEDKTQRPVDERKRPERRESAGVSG
ncbi:MAG TPA: ATP-binding protein [Gemmatimonadaceae bacterium]|nr:ATP-binding protein [Gemmatimonadaceae bacterium]